MTKNIVITGASTGIGYAAAAELTQAGYQVFGSVRKAADAERVRAALGANFTPLLMDVTDASAIAAAAQTVQAAVGAAGLAGLVNNAGIAVGGPLQHLPLDELRYQFEVNLFGLVAVTQAFLPLLGARKQAPHPPGRIINMSSVSGLVAYPFLAPYVASKHALEGLSDSLRVELKLYGIDVILIEPGSVRTPIWDKAEQIDVTRYAQSDYAPILNKLMTSMLAMGRKGMPVEKVARTIRLALESPHPKPRYAMPDKWLVGWVMPHLLPTRWVDALVARYLGLRRVQ
jgi:NAD(P)-dependent dehydrogenase (short-subunit alcohol dehydrogenase family)